MPRRSIGEWDTHPGAGQAKSDCERTGQKRTYHDILGHFDRGGIGVWKRAFIFESTKGKKKKQIAYDIKNTNPEAGRGFLKGTA